jgi:hypothetical protein
MNDRNQPTLESFRQRVTMLTHEIEQHCASNEYDGADDRDARLDWLDLERMADELSDLVHRYVQDGEGKAYKRELREKWAS